MKKRILPIIFVIAALYAAYYLGTQHAPSSDSVRVYNSSATVQPLTRSFSTSTTAAVKKTATPKPAVTKKPTATPKPTAAPTKKNKYVLNKKTKVFHYPSCSSVNQMKESNKIYSTSSRESIIRDGYRPCGRCNP